MTEDSVQNGSFALHLRERRLYTQSGEIHKKAS